MRDGKAKLDKPASGPDPDYGHAGQDGVKRVCLHQLRTIVDRDSHAVRSRTVSLGMNE